MKKLFKNLLVSTFMMVSSLGFGQDIIDVTTRMIPPFTPEFSTYNTKALVMLRNTTTRVAEISLEGVITGDNGIFITFPKNQAAPIILSGGQVMQLNAGQLQFYFAENNVATDGITPNELYRGDGLPPGNYQLCFRARSITNGVYLSPSAPAGCGSFTVEDVMNENAVRLTTQVIPPYSTYFSDYFNHNKVLVTLQNLSGADLELRLTGALEGDNGVAIRVPEGYILSRPIRLQPRQMLQLTGAELKQYFDENRITIQGISKDELLRGNGLPEGNYNLCMRAVDYETGIPLSPDQPAGCASLDIRQFEPPIIIQPICEESVRALQPQNILFTWTVPAGVRPDQVEYVLKVVEMYPPSIDPNQAMQAANVPPLLEKVVRSNTYIYSLADPVLEEGKRYAFRVTARASTLGRGASPINFRNDGHSQVCYFTYGDEISDNALSDNDVLQQEWSLTYETIQRINVDPADVLTNPIPTQSMSPDPEDSQDCIAGCNVAAPTNTSSVTIAPGDEVQIGKFTMTIATGNNTSGTGTINVNFLRTPINVSFNNLQVNTDYQVFGNSKVTAVPDGAIDPNQPYILGSVPNPQINDSDLDFIMQMAGQNARKVSLFSDSNEQAIGTPVALDYGNFDLIVIGLIFTPTSASMNAITSVELVNSTNADDFLVLSTSMCVRPNGLGEQGEVTLMQNKQVPLSSHVSMIFNENTTKATFDCQGIDALEINGSMRFDRTLLLPVDNSGSVVNGEVTTTFNTTIDDFNDWTIAVNNLSSPFTVPPLVGFKFEASDIAFDHSSSQNVSGMGNAFPSGYPGANKSWTGLYIGDLSVTLPPSLENNNSPISFAVSDVLLDKNGFSGDIDPQVAILPSGKLGGWNFSIDGFSLMLENSALNSASMGGDIQLPISQTELQYEVAIVESASEDDEVDFNFQMSTNQSVNVDMWFAELESGSHIYHWHRKRGE